MSGYRLSLPCGWHRLRPGAGLTEEQVEEISSTWAHHVSRDDSRFVLARRRLVEETGRLSTSLAAQGVSDHYFAPAGSSRGIGPMSMSISLLHAPAPPATVADALSSPTCPPSLLEGRTGIVWERRVERVTETVDAWVTTHVEPRHEAGRGQATLLSDVKVTFVSGVPDHAQAHVVLTARILGTEGASAQIVHLDEIVAGFTWC